MSYTYAEKEAMLNQILNIAETLTNQNWHADGGYIANDDCTMIINIYDYMDIYNYKIELSEILGTNELAEYIQELINEQMEEK